MSSNDLVPWRRHRANSSSAVPNFYSERQRRRRLRERRNVPSGAMPSFDETVDPENLIRVFYELKRKAGGAPGPDGVRYEDLGRREVPQIMRKLSDELKAQTYRPGKSRSVEIPKHGTSETRRLRLRNIVDRVVATALAEALTPLLEAAFIATSYGFRPGQCAWWMLVNLELTMIAEHRWVLAIDDVRKAFDRVRISDVLAQLAKHICCPQILALTGVVLRGGEDQRKKELGIDQGSAISPLMLNLQLHHGLDIPFGQQQLQHPSLFRYADNIALPCRDVPEGQRALNRTRGLLTQIGHSLKGKGGGIFDLEAGERAELLGFRISIENGRVRYDLAEENLERLEARLKETHGSINPPQTARQTALGWLDAMGPAFATATGNDVPRRILGMAAEQGFREFPSLEALRARWQDSHDQWLRGREIACQRRGLSLCDDLGAASVPTPSAIRP
jgi:retron-type reverse transcriptase